MTTAEAIVKLRTIVGETVAGFFTAAQVADSLDNGQIKCFDVGIAKFDSFKILGKYVNTDFLNALKKTDTQTPGISGLYEVTLPTGYYKTRFAQINMYGDADPTHLKIADLVEFEEAKRRESNSLLAPTIDTPVCYIKDGKIGFRPDITGGTVGGMLHHYWKKLTTITTSSTDFELSPQAHIYIVHYAAAVLFTKRKKYEQAAQQEMLGNQIINLIV